MLNFQGTMNEDDLKKIINTKHLKNYSVKVEKSDLNISGLATFENNNEKDIFLNEWSTKITNYNVDLDESN